MNTFCQTWSNVERPVMSCDAIDEKLIFAMQSFAVIVNMYIAIILDNFEEILQQDETGVSLGDFDTFYEVWGRYDPRATQFVTLHELSNLLHHLHPPLQLPKPNEVRRLKNFAVSKSSAQVDSVFCRSCLQYRSHPLGPMTCSNITVPLVTPSLVPS